MCGCGSALSPQAYLVDLLDYTVEHVRLNDSEVDLPELEARFGQPFGGLPLDCAFASLPVRQVRLCVEVMHKRRVLLTDPQVGTAVGAAVSAHMPRAYDALLRALGTSHRELRLARSDTEANQRVGDRLGIPASQVDTLRLEAGGSGAQGLTEDNLERLFGFQATARDPLSTGAKLGDGQAQLARRSSWGDVAQEHRRPRPAVRQHSHGGKCP